MSKGSFWHYLPFIMLQTIKNIEERFFGDITKNNSKTLKVFRRNMRILKQSHSAKKCERRRPFEIFQNLFFCKISKNRRVDVWNKSLPKSKLWGKSHSGGKSGKGILLLWNGFVFHVRGFGCGQNQVLNTCGKSPQCQCSKSRPFRVTLTKYYTVM